MRRQIPDRENVKGRPGAIAPCGPGALPLTADKDGAFPIRIARDGVWFYQGTPIHRKELAKLFSTVLRRESDGRYWLVTPVERGTIEVDDAPFTAVELAVEGKGNKTNLRFRSNFDEWVTAGADHPIAVSTDPDTREPSPYIRIRDNLDALIVRAVFYELVEMAEPVMRNGKNVLGVWSDGVLFELGEAT